MVNYQEGKIYKIINDKMPNLVYYGSTCNTFHKRMAQHKELTCSSRVLFEYGNPQIILVEKYPCNDKMELTQRERFYIENNDCVNKCIPGQTRKEYKEFNKEKIALQKKQYHENNKEHLSVKHNEWLKNNKEHISTYNNEYKKTNKEKIQLQKNKKTDCQCGGKYTHSHQARHFKSQKHLKYNQTL